MKLVTWNTQECRGIDGQVSCPRIVEGARALADFDVLCLQEISDNDHGACQAAEIAGLLPGFRIFFGAAQDTWEDGQRKRFGNLVATRLSVAQVQHHALPFPVDAGTESTPRMCTVVTVLVPGLGPVRIMTTHLEFYSKRQRLAQARALRALHLEYFDQAQSPPKGARNLAAEAILCGDFNSHPATEEHAAVAEASERSTLWDSWDLVHGGRPRTPTFCVHEQRYLPRPVAFDFVFVTDGLKDRVRRLEVDSATRASDHQPLLLELDAG
ncbi:endonuclease/exonuclease/phosphatase family protein [Ramlibacter monticola]|uniref:Endonuclease/exonuclease/phosphatase family protein n=1 Tax=Ramlibacter monticola TaxID=1926872 RepID=A0A936YY96_9BURK|nr:endonuclease/exonuclease/phosphatase family protein [Ramlibacter monticola]MBL0391685.1 endonuclease/exonuclease/phosphatase family protein [Ramlibacter monticola]